MNWKRNFVLIWEVFFRQIGLDYVPNSIVIHVQHKLLPIVTLVHDLATSTRHLRCWYLYHGLRWHRCQTCRCHQRSLIGRVGHNVLIVGSVLQWSWRNLENLGNTNT